MAEVASAVLGGVALLSLFQSCVACFGQVKLGNAFAKDHIYWQLRLSVAELRLSRWGVSVGFTTPEQSMLDDDIKTTELRALLGDPSTKEYHMVERLLANILAAFEEGKTSSERYKTRSNVEALVTGELHTGSPSQTTTSLRLKLRQIASRYQQGSSIGKRIAWVLYARDDFIRLLDTVNTLLDALTTYFPPLSEPQTKLMKEEVLEIRDERAVELLKDVSGSEDAPLRDLADEFLRNAQSTRHTFFQLQADDEARITAGNYREGGASSGCEGSGHDYLRVVAKGSSRVFAGNIVGGKGPFDD